MMSITYHLLVGVIVLLNRSSSILDGFLVANAGRETCFRERETVIFSCQFPFNFGALDWDGIGFDCPDNSTSVANNIITLDLQALDCSLAEVKYGSCGPYSANLTCIFIEDEAYLFSVLKFESNYTMNGGNIGCLFRGENKTFPVRVGVTPNPPSKVRETVRQDQSCHFVWTPPINGSIGGIGGYNISYGENCGQCTPAAGFLNQTNNLTCAADCVGCIKEYNKMCHFEVSTVSEDCWFDSPLVEATSDSPINSRADIRVIIPCFLNNTNPPIFVEWIYTFSEESRSAFSGFLVTISDQSDHSVEDILLDSTARSKYVNSTALKEADGSGFVGVMWSVTVEVALMERNKFTYDTIQFSADDNIMSDPSFAVTPRQCIEVSINDHCDKRSNTFQAQIQFINGTCGSESELINATSNYTLNKDYKTCIPVGANTICYSIVLFRNELELNRTKKQELVLMPCTLEASNSTSVKINSTIGDIPLGVKVTVPHNTQLYFSCDPNCILNNENNQTHCANGSFQPAVPPILRDGCDCSENFWTTANIIGVAIGAFVAALALLVGFIVILALVCRHFINRRSARGGHTLNDGTTQTPAGGAKYEPPAMVPMRSFTI